ncbi:MULTISPECIES: HAMP domain-containing sensor histidine kinase [unclassified Pseudomonas]|uniref:sensor histidine kinase n=1 Tax=unclassified Pseudomonas TaxID=196821 RepID=UPI000D33937D|nr:MULTISPECIES: HAMP domain-containing sensor histidine kinase [unclassified Pseudomonas]RAU45135.1 sensor histidine kinase [Pseudomonas sp. RIT 409]RAU51415.1 sensor histidine kinase [Pseudomonas sp. RIT 412]
MKAGFGWPRTLASRLSLIFLISLVLAHGMSFGLQFYERYQSAMTMMLGNMQQDLTTTLAMLERLPAEERAAWLPRFEHPNYRYVLGTGQTGTPMDMNKAPISVHTMQAALGRDYPVVFNTIPDSRPHYQAHLTLRDGNPLTIDVRPAITPLSPWLPLLLIGQLVLLVTCTWLAVRTAIRPLTRLSQAVDTLDPNGEGIRLDESGPTEVAYAAVAFNSMQQRIATYVKERMQLLAAISHDLQTPITRMKLRAEFMDDGIEKDKLWSDLNEMQHLVQEGVAYARSMDTSTEPPKRVNLDAFLDSLVFDYQDMNQSVQLSGKAQAVIDTRPHALRRVLVNLTDNALKFAGAAEVQVQSQGEQGVSIQVLDRGPGISQAELAEVLKPFYRVESSRNRDTGGTGLGLAIAQQLARALGGSLTLSNRDGGGLCAELKLPRTLA